MSIESGWVTFRGAIHPEASQAQFHDMRLAFFTGAQHIFNFILELWEENKGEEEAEERLRMIARELDKFNAELNLMTRPTQGSA